MVQTEIPTTTGVAKDPVETNWIPVSYLWPLRFILGFQFLSAWARRYINAPAKLDWYAKSNIAHKFSTMMPHALPPIRAMMQWLLLHPHLAWAFLIMFTWIEFTVGLFLLTGTMTRLAALGGTLLSFGMLFGNGWLGTACIDEFQIGTVEGIGAMIFLFIGAGSFSVDHWIHKYWDGHVRLGKLDIHLT
ncbi:TQO small subunit DoxD [Sulfobacillus thermosulfidooxidans]|uniref:TQO small subunit DoxD n=1 Tax=Sulfobacillus thermosulfidooxidans TaxID=28034 RepID=UPI0006B676E0|nr:TQO small subunit DoxD [Sulfobacillus thermosulfidooxidans]